MKSIFSYILNLILFLVVVSLIMFLKLVGFKVSSFIGKYIGLLVGRFHKSNKVAYSNLKMVFPYKSESEIKKIIRGMWINLGRNFAEFPLVSSVDSQFIKNNIDNNDLEKLQNFLKQHPKIILISAHFGAWELAPKVIEMLNMPIYLVYRHLNVNLFERLVAFLRGKYVSGVIPKKVTGARKLINILKENEQAVLCMLMDQKMNNGVDARFFGRLAKTSSSAAELSKKFNIPIVMANIKRIGDSTKYQVNIDPFITTIPTNNEEVLRLTQQINDMFEIWIKESPEQWFWVHNRWPK
ncbi:lysophospholipid acyltransferase family protein [Rickettsiales endosymbiont of Stachyamoeba lipophora]|uniref:lysophospholipid acyltransferase family protein n=1 Tax=Rickettsiales endosymbiont of Stachyamoeba lipophora TaxID=2486578 RepID=UPI000F64F4E3|nr:lysophospholipid acyltransferase family protein [Rickettsiales endosymbiont of Stachyamoeba lipophora]AZL16166.1 hypothetical protein EF513_06445 [Rickettsiales endosymbiont of Stachyamoeba lipophora]